MEEEWIEKLIYCYNNMYCRFCTSHSQIKKNHVIVSYYLEVSLPASQKLTFVMQSKYLTSFFDGLLTASLNVCVQNVQRISTQKELEGTKKLLQNFGGPSLPPKLIVDIKLLNMCFPLYTYN